MVVLGIGVSLFQSASTQFVGGTNVLNTLASGGTLPVPYYVYILIACATLLISILWTLLAKGVWKHLNIFAGIIGGYLIACCIPGLINFSSLNVVVDGSVQIEKIISYPHVINMGQVFSHIKLVPSLLVFIVFFVSAMETIGDTSALAEAGLGRKPTAREMGGCLPFDGFNSTIGCCFGALPMTSFSEYVGVVAQTKVVNRFTIFIGACFLVAVGFFPYLSLVLLTIPDCVMGGIMVVLFGSIAVIGIKMLASIGFSEKNTIIAAVSLALGFRITLVPDFFTVLKIADIKWLGDIMSNCVINIFVIAFILSWALPNSMDIPFKKKNVK